MTDHVHDLRSVREATDRLLAAVAKLDNAALAGESHLPGWTRGHVLAHLARNADALVNVFEGRPMYESASARDADIERDSGRPLEEQLPDLRDSGAAFLATTEPAQDWSRTVELRNGVTDLAANVPFRRLVEVELHHVDLDIGYELADLPDEFTGREIAFLADRWSGRPEVPPTALAAADGRTWRTGSAGDPAVTVTGSAAALLAWLAGRGDKGASLTAAGGPLPALPPL
ncbi:maleylpyruvate isomerase family mycothiol-dependent enzyme [Streptomyces antarcticus]|uniref:maleylpyruvate isomerase family mycothiol-dependent enzyme n=1 Tax=Streptomyces antarcticus TaxID=2996458 RepID=UPI00226E5B87|nr:MULTISPECIES: maleylpyruvate isomerase family mycothiol-dependent enzyme [unclassified Streptomyces]MCY0945565.1 maleylpyruvate isomerase family mycothiol-dependent enzyme [Streptomyces sp. H34-AA3]MCY0952179.1 maleylpyruvate isomerase family mycothiol-dependent enzyme [Streptomyces sp. H27-S2]MCZ4085504.1 maleylpyruvate isomerase family mycothiol-dependent enzyme [Streptomyces sp. H34-S5]